ncbi:cellobiohydrolase [Nocardioides sp. zg-579]|uniref:Glucanase n=1 Tax=Nocardioides marmotae TaxID=2663857 RepID=A0A6I3JA73_9ACTN|nr:glycoside hydrolase family 6 protein [Nocardioides marmotae]MCR6031379.1 cellobiohydrolase [Gordonia jinghuaiqii]MTB95018.1 cellobiohydrolase [Nocardioides marmotae]QKE02481.1 cellobiohydrolase [Nocardioides marmotae]
MPDGTTRAPRALPFAAGALVVVVVLVVVGVLVARAQHLGPWELGPQERNRFAEQPQYVDPDSRTGQAAWQAEADGRADEAAAFAELAQVPQGIWVTPEERPPGAVGQYVSAVLAAADEAGRVPLLVVYGIPDRDCTGGYSSGGLDVGSYVPWVQEIATAAAPYAAAVVLEPDALASAVECDRRQERVDLLARAVDALAAAGVTTYVDGGHSGWVPARKVAALLREVGVDKVRGFATNVSNYQTDPDEVAWAERLSGLVGGTHYVVDSGRNGAGSPPEDWCNPPGQALGQEPGYVDDGTGLDAYLWVKPPGESDGECNGGPPAGEFWAQRALELIGAS